MDETDGGFKLLLEKYLAKIQKPEKRFMAVETFALIATILRRNPELNFSQNADIDKILQVRNKMMFLTIFNKFSSRIRWRILVKTKKNFTMPPPILP